MSKETYHHGDLKNALIAAGIEILNREGVGALSLRKVARQAGVSHAAPYAHYADKQALVAAISTEGYRRVYERMAAVADATSDPLSQLVQAAWAYLCFAIEDPAHFKITFAGIVEKESDYPALVEMTRRGFAGVRQIVARCQAAGILGEGSADLITIAVWSQVHGLASLIVNGQISHTVLDQVPTKRLLVTCLQQFVHTPIEAALLE